MGDRAMVAIQGDQGRVYLYTHWNGAELPATVQQALRRRQRWDDSAYLARIVFGQMITSDPSGPLNETGFGIAPKPATDLQYKILVLDIGDNEQRVYLEHRPGRAEPTSIAMDFEEFVALDKPTWESLDKH